MMTIKFREERAMYPKLDVSGDVNHCYEAILSLTDNQARIIGNVLAKHQEGIDQTLELDLENYTFSIDPPNPSRSNGPIVGIDDAFEP